jgi:membrane protease YdiL (CAAX protease family)
MTSKPVLSFLLISYGWTWLVGLPLLAQRRGWVALGLPEAWEGLAAFGPLIAAVLVTSAGGASGVKWLLDGLRHWRVGGGWLAFCCLSPLLLLVAAVLIVRAGTGEWPDFTRLAAGELGTVAGILDLVIIAALVQGLGEEPGWRGWLLPRFRRRWKPLAATLALFPLWLFWHLLAFLGRPEFGPAQFAAFSVGILSAAIWLTLIWEGTGSILMAVIWHAAINITRGIALATSTALFLTMSTMVLVGAVAIVLWWQARSRVATRAAAQEPAVSRARDMQR